MERCKAHSIEFDDEFLLKQLGESENKTNYERRSRKISAIVSFLCHQWPRNVIDMLAARRRCLSLMKVTCFFQFRTYE